MLLRLWLIISMEMTPAILAWPSKATTGRLRPTAKTVH
jgi:hypothetical protein